jgi:hypothetical protein
VDYHTGTSEFATSLAHFKDHLGPNARVLVTTGSGAECDYAPEPGWSVDELDFGEALSFVDETPYDGIWACRSLNYIPPVELFATLCNLRANLRRGGGYGAIFTLAEGEHVVEQTLRGEFYRASYPAGLVLKLHRQAGLKPVATTAVRAGDGAACLFILAA